MNKLQILKTNILVEFDLEKKKIMLMFVLFLVFGLTSVVTQIYLPDILALSGFELVNPPQPSLFGVLSDYWGDIVLFALIIILIMMTTFSAELDVNKQVYFYLSRPISRNTYYLTRTLLKVISVMFIFSIASLIVYFYALAFFDQVDFIKIIQSILLLSMSLGSIVAVVIMFSTKFSTGNTGISSFGFIFFQLIIALIEPLKWLSPSSLGNEWVKVLTGTISENNLFLTFFALGLWLIIPMIIGWIFYTKRDL
jgi:ABC-2 type transport system permease protein